MRRAVVAVAALLALAAVVLLIASRLGINRLPGDFVVRRGNFTFYAPVGLMIVASIVLTLLVNLFWRR